MGHILVNGPSASLKVICSISIILVSAFDSFLKRDLIHIIIKFMTLKCTSHLFLVYSQS